MFADRRPARAGGRDETPRGGHPGRDAAPTGRPPTGPDLISGGLTDQQERAATHLGGHLLIAAGAGTGKTTALAARLGVLLARGVEPERIMLLTFTRRAATELVRRAEATAQRSAGAVWAGTFHATAHRFLRRWGRLIGLPPDITVLDAVDTADLLALVRDELREGRSPPERTASPATMASILSRVVNTRTPLSAVLARWYPWCVPERDELAATFSAYVARKRARRVVDYDDLLVLWEALLAAPEAREVLGGRFDHVLVDEHQDTNAVQAAILERLAGLGATITAVGDDAQAIYGFRGATVRNIWEFPERFGAEVVVLDRNHRSRPEILATANAVMADAPHHREVVLWSTRPSGPRPELVDCADEADQAAQVCARILDHLEAGIPLHRQAVLFRAAHHSDDLEVELTFRRIPFVKYGGLKFLEASHVKDLLALLRLARNPADELAWYRLLPRIDGIGPATARRLASAAAGAGAPADPARDGVPERAREGYDGLVAAVGAAATATDPAEAVASVRRWLDPVIRRHHRNAEARINDLDALERVARRSASVDELLADLTLDPPASTGDLAGPPSLDTDALCLTTIHSAKGGEWDVVHLIHLTDGNLPSDLSTGCAEEVAEERRLLYVAVTRARDHLHCYVPLRYHQGPVRSADRHGYAQPSRFLTPAVTATMDRSRAGARPTFGGPEPDGVSGGEPGRLAEADAAIAALWE